MHDNAGATTRRELARRFLSAPFTARTWMETVHLVLDFPIGVAGFVYAVTMVAVSAGLLVTLIGIPLLAVAVFAARWFGAAERWRAEVLLREPVESPGPLRPVKTPLDALKVTLLDPVGWRALLYLVLLFVTGTFGFVVVVTFWACGLLLPTYPAWYFLFAGSGGGIQVGGETIHSAGGMALLALAGLAILFVTPWVVRGLAHLDRAMVRSLLGPTFLSDRVQALQHSRGQAVDTAAADLRRIERDLHDGAQARLVALAMDLGMAREKLASGEHLEQATQLVTSAHEEVKHALVELRDLARGIYPAVLTDRGLDPALSSLAARCTVPVTVTVDLPARPAPAIEAIAYFSASELLANISKHSFARAAAVTVRRAGDRLLVEVRDDGVGGADPRRGTGLTGLAERVHAVDGRFFVDSPAGGPTIMTVELPWTS